MKDDGKGRDDDDFSRRDTSSSQRRRTGGFPPRVGPYRVLGRLGQGGCGVVYLARDPDLGRLLAVKVLHGWAVADPEARSHLHREARAAATVQHPNVVTVFAVEMRGDPPYIAMEYVPGQTLAEVFPWPGVDLAELVDIAVQVARGLNCAHGERIVHGDIKPQNIRLYDLDGDGVWVKIVDFGLARPVLAADRKVSGTPGYIAPEVLEGGSVDGRADLFSLGVTLYWALTGGGRRPFPGWKPDEIGNRTLADQPLPLHELSGTGFEWLEPVVRRCLEKDPDRRYQSGKEVVEALRAGGQAVRTRGAVKTQDAVRTRGAVKTRGRVASGQEPGRPKATPVRTRGAAPAALRARLLLRAFSPRAAKSQAPAGDLEVRPRRPAGAGREDLAMMVCDSGIDGLLQGTGPIERVAVSVQAALDDLLAGELALRLVKGERVPAGATRFARYAAELRHAPHPLAFPLPRSPEGVLLAMRCLEGGDLTDPAAAERFLRQWPRLGVAILTAAEEDIDPFQVPFLAEDTEFLREREYLRQDRERYLADVERGERLSLPETGERPGAGVLHLDSPQSDLHEYWAFDDKEAATRCGVLVVRREPGEWLFVAHPGQGISLSPLAERLSSAQAKGGRPVSSGDSRWVVAGGGGRLASPAGGSRIEDAEILAVLGKWIEAGCR